MTKHHCVGYNIVFSKQTAPTPFIRYIYSVSFNVFCQLPLHIKSMNVTPKDYSNPIGCQTGLRTHSFYTLFQARLYLKQALKQVVKRRRNISEKQPCFGNQFIQLESCKTRASSSKFSNIKSDDLFKRILFKRFFLRLKSRKKSC